MMEHERNGELGLWRATAIALITFILGNGLAFLIFGMNTASKSDVSATEKRLTDRLALLEQRDTALTDQVNQMLGEMKAKGLAH